MATWYIKDDGIPYLEEFPQMCEIDDFPTAMWRIKDGELPYRVTFPQMCEIDDFPIALWRIKDGELPYRATFPDCEFLGAFCHAENLSSVKIPKSVKKIGPYAFTYTSLSEVTIASDCTYSETTFPKDCIINFYPD